MTANSVNINWAEGGFYASWSEKEEKDGRNKFTYKKKVFTSQADVAAWLKEFKFGEDVYTTEE